LPNRLAWLGLGGNLGDVRSAMIAGLEYLDRLDEVDVLRVSGLYETPPWGKTDQPAFLNACAEISTSLGPRALLRACLDAEQALHRVRGERWGPRTIDIDILAMDGVEVAEDGLSIPHARITGRAFALVPLHDLVPQLVVSGRTVENWLSGLASDLIRQLSGSSQWRRGLPPWTDDRMQNQS
jgi:2-amino-4-hydroxy-6-hydroxymethyldihydropteridine diphosphokinase